MIYVSPSRVDHCFICGSIVQRMPKSAEKITCHECRRGAHNPATQYNKGCRCDVCREWQSGQRRKYRPATPKACLTCGELIRGRSVSTYCGPCGAAIRRRQYPRAVPDAVRLEVFERDEWVCQICGHPTAPLDDSNSADYPTLDHVEPQSLTLVPDHSKSNLRCAHRGCNSRRGNRV